MAEGREDGERPPTRRERRVLAQQLRHQLPLAARHALDEPQLRVRGRAGQQGLLVRRLIVAASLQMTKLMKLN